MATTLRDVAQLARVSVKTVSNVVNGHPHVSGDVRRRVDEAVRQLGYRPDLAARALRTGRTGLIALVLPGVDEPCPPRLLDQIIGQAARFGLQVVIEPLTDPRRPGRTGLARVDAVLLAAETVTPELVGAHGRTGRPLVVLGAKLDPRYDCVALDATVAARDATNHLLRTGRRRIAAVGAHADRPAQPRTIGYRQAVAQLGLPPDYLQTTPGQRYADGYHAAQTLLNHRQRPDAIFCYHDRLAGGVLRAAAEKGLRVPEDLAVIGIGGSEEGRYSRPTLSTVATEPGYIARQALELLTRRFTGPAAATSQIVVPHVVIPRESTGPAANLSG